MRTAKFLPQVRKAYATFPDDVQDELGFAIERAQAGKMHPQAKPLPEFGAGVYEARASDGGNAYRAIYYVRLAHHVYVVEAFVKKSKSGRDIPREVKEAIRAGIHAAEAEEADLVAQGVPVMEEGA